MAEGLAPSIAGNAAAQSNYSPRERGDSGISAHSGWLRSCLLTTLPPLLFVRRLPPWTGDAVPAAHRACCRGRGVIRGLCPGRPCPGTALLLPGGAWVAVPWSLLGRPWQAQARLAGLSVSSSSSSALERGVACVGSSVPARLSSAQGGHPPPSCPLLEVP